MNIKHLVVNFINDFRLVFTKSLKVTRFSTLQGKWWVRGIQVGSSDCKE